MGANADGTRSVERSAWDSKRRGGSRWEIKGKGGEEGGKRREEAVDGK